MTKERILFRTLLFCCKADFRSVKIRGYFFNEIVGLASSPKARANVKDSRCLIVESLRLLRTNCSVKSFYYSITNFKTCLQARGYQHNLIEKITSEIKFTEWKSALQKNEKVRNKIIPFFTTYHPALFN